MWLLNTTTLALEEFIGSHIPSYAILSHTWEDGEILFRDIQNGLDSAPAVGKKGYRKIKAFCQLAAADGASYVWVDTCCIDKSSSAELSEAINSMFAWYQSASTCYVYLSDLLADAELTAALAHCRWWTRGWTLQELVAPRELRFFDQGWNFRGTKTELAGLISSITGIEPPVLLHAVQLSSLPVATKMSWVAHRQTTRVEDIGYCLLGIFDVNMPLLYGEGRRAFTRLQEEIISSTHDLSIFAWQSVSQDVAEYAPRYSGLLARDPIHFSDCGRIARRGNTYLRPDLSVTNRGIRMKTEIIASRRADSPGWHYLLCLDCTLGDETGDVLAIYLRKCGPDMFVREKPGILLPVSNTSVGYRPRNLYFLSSIPKYLPVSPEQQVKFERDLIVGNRACGVCIQLPPDLDTMWERPVSHWDAHHSVFFSLYDERMEEKDFGWCKFHILGKIHVDGKALSVDCFFFCYGWGQDIVCTIADAYACDKVLMEQFFATLEVAEANIVPWALRRSSSFGIPLQSSVTVRGVDYGVEAELRLAVTKTFRPDIYNDWIYQIEVLVA